MSQRPIKITYSFPILVRREPSRERRFGRSSQAEPLIMELPLRYGKRVRASSATRTKARVRAEIVSSSRHLFVPKLVRS